MLRIRVTECSAAPPLSEPFSREEKAVLAAREWLASLAARGEDLVVTLAGPDMVYQMVVSPEYGGMGIIRPALDKPPSGALVVSRQCTAMYFPEQNRKLVTRPLAAQARLSLGLTYTEGAARPHQLSFGFGLHYTKDTRAGVPCTLTTSMCPGIFLPDLHQPTVTSQWTGNVLTLRSEQTTVVIEETTGRLLSARQGDGEGATFVATGSGLFAGLMQEIEGATRHCRNDFDADHPLRSVLQCEALDPLLSWLYADRTEVDKQRLQVARKLLAAVLADPVDGWLTTLSLDDAPARDKFNLPQEPADDSDWWQYVKVGARLALAQNERLFPRNTWPSVLLRQTAFVTMRRDAQLIDDLTDLYARRDAGPICQLLSAWLTANLAPETSRRFAARGLERMSAAEFQKDVAELLRPDYPLGQGAIRVADALRNLTDEEAQAFDETPLQPVVRELRRIKGPISDGLQPALVRSWETGLRELVRTHLQTLTAAEMAQ